MLVTLLVKFRSKDCKTTELGLLLQVSPVRIVTFVENLGSHLKAQNQHASSPQTFQHISYGMRRGNLPENQDVLSLVIISFILVTCMQ